jgi:hypothetical protein
LEGVVTNVKRFGVAAALVLLAIVTSDADASSITVIDFATGQNPEGIISTTGGTRDVNWVGTDAVGTQFSISPNVYVVDQTNPDWYFQWLANGPNSSWIAPNPFDVHGNGDFTVSYTFNLTGTNLATAVFSGGGWSIDDEGWVLINGQRIGELGRNYWGFLNPFTIPVGLLLQGANTLSITSRNTDTDFEAVRLEGTLTVDNVITPLPASLPLFATGLGALVLLGFRKKPNDSLI